MVYLYVVAAKDYLKGLFMRFIQIIAIIHIWIWSRQMQLFLIHKFHSNSCALDIAASFLFKVHWMTSFLTSRILYVVRNDVGQSIAVEMLGWASGHLASVFYRIENDMTNKREMCILLQKNSMIKFCCQMATQIKLFYSFWSLKASMFEKTWCTLIPLQFHFGGAYTSNSHLEGFFVISTGNISHLLILLLKAS